MNAYEELLAFLTEGEQVESLVFGNFGHDNGSELYWDDYEWEQWGECPSVKNPIERENIGKIMSLETAKPYMQGWRFEHDMGGLNCYGMYIWTNKRIIWVGKYDGATWLSSAPRNPIECRPLMSGGG